MGIMLEKEAEDFLEKEGFNVVKREFVIKKEHFKSLKIKFPLAMKVLSKKIIHKAKMGGVMLNIKNTEEAERAFEKMQKMPGFEGVVVQEMISGEYVIIGLKNTPEFGMAIMFGKGGSRVEEIRDVSFRICPISWKDADDMMKETNVYDALKQKKFNAELVKKSLLRLSALAKSNPQIKELDINPLIVSENDAVVVDARIVT